MRGHHCRPSDFRVSVVVNHLLMPNARLEALAGDEIAEALGREYRSQHDGRSSEHDCTIFLGEDEFALVEVTEDCDPEFQGSMVYSYEHPEELIRDLRSGSGEWAFDLDPTARIVNVETSTLQQIVDALTRVGRERHDTFDPMHPELSDVCGLIPLNMVFKVGTASDRAHLMFARGAIGTFLRSDPDVLTDYLRGFLAQSHIQSKVARHLERAAGRRAWLAVVVSSATPASVFLRMIGATFGTEPPTQPLQLPDDLDGVWILSGEKRRIACYRRDEGWAAWNFDGDVLEPVSKQPTVCDPVEFTYCPTAQSPGRRAECMDL
jgi:hypothetical protein